MGMRGLRIFATTIALAGALSACSDTTIGSFSVNEDLPESQVEGGGIVTLLPAELAPCNLDINSS